MTEDSGIRAALKTKNGWSAQNLSNRITGLKNKHLMSRQHALYVLAHHNGIDLEKYGLDGATLIEVGRLASGLNNEVPRQSIQVPASRVLSVQKDKPQTPAIKFASREMHDRITRSSRKSFTNGLHEEAIHKAFQSVNNRVKKLTASSQDGKKLMGWAFSNSPQLQMTSLTSESEENEHEGLRFLAQGAMLMRNPRAHEDQWEPDEDELAVLELLSLASYLHRCLDRCESYSI